MQIPLIQPQTEWVMPDGYPDLAGYREVAIDLETKDPNLITMGSGWARKDVLTPQIPGDEQHSFTFLCFGLLVSRDQGGGLRICSYPHCLDAQILFKRLSLMAGKKEK